MNPVDMFAPRRIVTVIPTNKRKRLMSNTASATPAIRLDEAPLPPARAVDADSFVQQIAKLQVGEVASRATRFDGESTPWSEILAEKARQGRTLSTQVARAKAKRDVTRPTYTTTIGDMRAAEGDIFVVVTVTRLM